MAAAISAQFLYFERDKVNTDLSHPPGGKHTLWLVVHSVNERALAEREEDQGEVVLGGQDGGRVVEDAVGVASLQTGSTKYFLFQVLFLALKTLILLMAGFPSELTFHVLMYFSTCVFPKRS